jgi:hypothetical protein
MEDIKTMASAAHDECYVHTVGKHTCTAHVFTALCLRINKATLSTTIRCVWKVLVKTFYSANATCESQPGHTEVYRDFQVTTGKCRESSLLYIELWAEIAQLV